MKNLKYIILVIIVLFIFFKYMLKKYNVKLEVYDSEDKIITKDSPVQSIKQLQELINDWFITRNYKDRLVVDGIFGRETKKAIKLLHGSTEITIKQLREYVENI